MKPIYVVGAGLWGAVIAERISSELARPVRLIEKRPQSGGNCHSAVDPDSGVECHCYGSHIFHTSDETVWRYIRRFTAFNDYRHRVLTSFRQQVYPLPINLMTINQFYRKNLSSDAARALLASEAARDTGHPPRNFEEKAVSLVGRPLYEAFFRGYTLKQWQRDPRELPAELISRLPLRFHYQDRYFADCYEGIPLDGYAALFRQLLANPLIELELNTDFRERRDSLPPDAIICYSGRLDAYFDYRFGRLEWRTVRFEIEHPDTADYQGCSVMNYADAEIPYTRIHEFKHYHPERPDTGRTVIYKEYSQTTGPEDEPYYPVDTPDNRRKAAEYRQLAAQTPGLFIGGRLGNYRYFDMDDTIADALREYETNLKPYLLAERETS